MTIIYENYRVFVLYILFIFVLMKQKGRFVRARDFS